MFLSILWCCHINSFNMAETWFWLLLALSLIKETHFVPPIIPMLKVDQYLNNKGACPLEHSILCSQKCFHITFIYSHSLNSMSHTQHHPILQMSKLINHLYIYFFNSRKFLEKPNHQIAVEEDPNYLFFTSVKKQKACFIHRELKMTWVIVLIIFKSDTTKLCFSYYAFGIN